MGWIWILIPLTALSIPIIAILSSVIEKYIKAQERQANLMTEEFMDEMMALKESSEEQRKMLEQRIANLEAIVSAKAEQGQLMPALPVADERHAMPDLTAQKELRNDEKIAMLVEELEE